MTRLIIGPLTLVIALGAGLSLATRDSPPERGSSVGEPPAMVIRMEAEGDIDPNNLPALVGFADQVFKGVVVEKASTVPIQATGPDGDLGEIPQTQFRVNVLENIEGKAQGDVVVNQAGGYDSDGNLVLVENDALLVAGSTYMFVTRYDEQHAWYSIVAPDEKAKNEFETRAEGDRLEQTYETAEANEIPYDEDPNATGSTASNPR